MQTQLLATLLLSLAIACSWSRFRTIFSQAADNTILLSPATTLASAICLSASALAFVAQGCAHRRHYDCARGTRLRLIVAVLSTLSYVILGEHIDTRT